MASHSVVSQRMGVDAFVERLTDASFAGQRIVVFVNSVEMGGVEEHVRQVATGLARRGAQVTVVVPEEAAIDPLAVAIRAAGVPVVRLTLAWSQQRWASLKRFRRLVRLFRARKTQLLHFHLTGYTGGRWVVLAAWLAGVPTVVCTLQITPSEPQSWKTRLDRAIVGLMVHWYVAVSQVSRQRLEQFLGMPSDKLLVAPNAVELDRFEAPVQPARQTVRRLHGIPDDAPVIGSLARLNHQKGLTYLVAAMPAILAAHPDTHALIVGEGGLRGELEAQAAALGVAERLHLVGYHANTVDYLRAMDLFVLPSLYEGMPLAILEAMGASLPVVATWVDGTPEAVDDGVTGTLIPPEDPAALARAVNALLADPALAARMAGAGKARSEQFSEAALLERLAVVYQQAARDSTRAARP